MAVGIWDGDAEAGLAIDAALLRAVLAFCLHSEEMGGEKGREKGGAMDEGNGELEANQLQQRVPAAEQTRLSGLMRRDLADWKTPLSTLSDPELVALVRFFALAEVELPGWEAGKRSPAIACARELRARGSYPAELTRWLRKHSSNRFLPYGSLLDGAA